MHKFSGWMMELAERTMMAGLYKAEKILKSIDDEEASSDEIHDLSHAMEVICKSNKILSLTPEHTEEHHTENKVDMTKAAKI